MVSRLEPAFAFLSFGREWAVHSKSELSMAEAESGVFNVKVIGNYIKIF